MYEEDRPSTRQAVVREEPGAYVIDVAVPGFEREELTVETIGHRVVVHGDCATRANEPFRITRHLQESFRLPDDADLVGLDVVYRRGSLEFRTGRKQLERQTIAVRPDCLISPTPNGC